MNQAGKQTKAKSNTYPVHYPILRPINIKPPEGGFILLDGLGRNRTENIGIFCSIAYCRQIRALR